MHESQSLWQYFADSVTKTLDGCFLYTVFMSGFGSVLFAKN